MKNRVGFSGSGFSRQPSQQVKQEVYSEEEEIHQSNREQDQTRLFSDISSLDHNRLNPKPFSEHILTPEHSTLYPEQTKPCDNIKTSPTKSNLSLDESTGRTDVKGIEYTTVKLNPMVKLELNYDLELHSSTHQREGKEDILNDQVCAIFSGNLLISYPPTLAFFIILLDSHLLKKCTAIAVENEDIIKNMKIDCINIKCCLNESLHL